MNNCPVCDMTVSTNANKPFKSKGGRGTITYESTYCSRYCREYDERNMEKEPISDSKHHKGIFGFPPIEVPCLDIVHCDVTGAPSDGDVQLDDAVNQESGLVRCWHPSLHGNGLND